MTMITEDYISFETAKLLKEKGFDIPVKYYYWKDTTIHSSCYNWNEETEKYSKPTLQMVMKWLKKVHNIHIGINPISGKGYNATIYDVADFDDYGIISDTEFFFHVEEACEAAIKYCLEHLIK